MLITYILLRDIILPLAIAAFIIDADMPRRHVAFSYMR